MNFIQRLENKFFKGTFMGQENTQSVEEQQQPVMETVEVPTVNTPDTEPAAPVQAEEPTETVAKPADDRSAFNCPDCGGEGLKDQNSVCDRCKGTGKDKA